MLVLKQMALIVNKRREKLINFYNLVAIVENRLLSRNDGRAHTQWRTTVHPLIKVIKDQNTTNLLYLVK